MLVTHRPEASTALLMQLCTPGDRSQPDGDRLAKVSDFAHIYADRCAPCCPKRKCSIPTQLQYKRHVGVKGEHHWPRLPAMPGLEGSQRETVGPTFWRCRPMALMLLCEYVLNSARNPPGEEFLYHTLLELYLSPELTDEVGAAAQPQDAAAAHSSRLARK